MSKSDICKEEFIRVGTTLYKLVNQPRLNGGYVKKRIVWNNETLRQDYGKHFLATVPKYDGFCTVPDHVNYRPVVDKFLNLYEPINYKPMEGDFPSIRSLVEHIFGEQYELGMDYLQLLYLQPIQKLPILLLVSEERNTGKSTFLNFLKALFQNNVTFNTNEDFRSQFNSDWAGKLLIVVDEVLLSRREDSERLKNLSTTLSYKVEAKGKDRDEIAFFAKFVLCSNNEYLPVIIDAGETRYWVRKIDRLQTDDTERKYLLSSTICSTGSYPPRKRAVCGLPRHCCTPKPCRRLSEATATDWRLRCANLYLISWQVWVSTLSLFAAMTFSRCWQTRMSKRRSIK